MEQLEPVAEGVQVADEMGAGQQKASAEMRDESASALAALSALVGNITGYFAGRADADDIDALDFCLHHLFGQVDYLYRSALPAILEITFVTAGQPFLEVILQEQHIWTHLRAVKFCVSRVELLCHLLNNVAERLLDELDMTSTAATVEACDTMPRLLLTKEGTMWQPPLDQERWEQALQTLMTSLGQWHEYYESLAGFAEQFPQVIPTIPTLPHIDETFGVLLDCAGAIFGDIVPGFQGISANDDDAVCVLLLDLMQQSDQLQAQFDRVIEPLHALIERFAPGIGHS
ncbi:MAG TPA: hypothetical protein VNE61_12545 [Ktedonobacteraceae bacterium]|nr:hypothetical protein [Ktedonobacteraceae bacterium]